MEDKTTSFVNNNNFTYDDENAHYRNKFISEYNKLTVSLSKNTTITDY